MVLESAHKDRFGRSVMKGVKMRIKDLRSFDKAGGVEGTLVSIFSLSKLFIMRY
jgi:hypothetical protein